MNLTDFDDAQQQALLDLTLLAMYADGHLAAVEDARIERLLTALGCDTDYDRAKHYDAAVARITRPATTKEGARAHAAKLAALFTTPEQRRKLIETLDDLMVSDKSIAAEECGFLAVIREALQMP